MHSLPDLIIDLTLISVYAGLITLLFKWLKQPVVLGYVIAGVIAGPYIDVLPTVSDKTNIMIWADIGVIFLLFGLGLEFSFKKIVNVGKAAMITASGNILFMLIIGYHVGLFLSWTTVDSLFLGGMLSMSSTTIIIKAFEDLNLRKQKFTNLVFGVLVVEDVVGILLLVLLPTLALGQNVNEAELVTSTLKLVFFLILWFSIGIYLVPTFMKKIDKYLNDELLLVVSIALCLLMVSLADVAGFSSALGAFIMGSILAESEQVERIEIVLKPVRDFFGAVFFVSVGMMVDPQMFIEYAYPILIIAIVVVTIKVTCSVTGFLLSGQQLKVAIMGGFSLAQVGEFAFIIAALGMKIGVLSDFVYPIIVAVSVLTTFTTPLMIKSSVPVYNFINRILPQRVQDFLDRTTSAKAETKAEKNMWRDLFRAYFSRTFLFSVLLITILYVAFEFIKPFIHILWPGIEGQVALAIGTLAVMSPFLCALLISRNNTPELYFNLWLEKKSNRIPLILLISLRLILAIFFIMLAVYGSLPVDPWIVFAFAAVMVIVLLRAKWLWGQYMKIETRFLMNLNRDQLEQKAKTLGNNSDIADEQDWLDSSLFVEQFAVGDTSEVIGKTLADLQYREKYAVNVFRILRTKGSVSVPRGTAEIKQGDSWLVVGTEKQLKSFANAVKSKSIKTSELGDTEDKIISLRDYVLNQQKYSEKGSDVLLCCAISVSPESNLAGTSILSSDIRGKTKCLVVGVERKSSLFINPEVDFVFKEGDLIWVVGEQSVLSNEIIKQASLQASA